MDARNEDPEANSNGMSKQKDKEEPRSSGSLVRAVAPGIGSSRGDGGLSMHLNNAQFRRQQSALTKSQRKANKKITKKHPEFELTYDMMLGIRTVVSGGESSMMGSKGKLGDEAFASGLKYRFPKLGSSKTPGHQSRDFKFKDYAPEVFRQLRHRFDIDPAEYLIRLSSDFPFLEFISNSKGGQFFFYTHDRQYMIKTQTKQESLFLRKILPEYYKYVCDEPNTLLARYFGMHRVKPHKRKPMYFVIMSSVFYTPKFIHEVYDLKGSRQGRAATEKEKTQPVPMLKDNDFVDRDGRLRFGTQKAKKFKEQIRKDCDFLRKLKIMDYSLLVGIHYDDRPIPAEERAELVENSKPLFGRARSRSRRSTSQISPPSEKITSQVLNFSTGDNKKPSSPSANSRSSRSVHGGKDAQASPSSPKRKSTPATSSPPLSPKRNSAPITSNTPPKNNSSALEPGEKYDVPSSSLAESPSHPDRARVLSSQDSLPTISPGVDQSPSLLGRHSLDIDKLQENKKSLEVEQMRSDHHLKSVSFNGVPSSLPSNDRANDDRRTHVSSKSHHRAPSSYAQSEPSFEGSMGQRASVRHSHVGDGPDTDGFTRGEHKRRQSNYGYHMKKKSRKQQITSPHQTEFRGPDLDELGRDLDEVKGAPPIIPEEGIPEEGSDAPPRTLSLFSQDDGGIRSKTKDGKDDHAIYFCGIIDILQQYTTKKALEHMVKGIKYDASTISAVNPTDYANRLNKFLENRIV